MRDSDRVRAWAEERIRIEDDNEITIADLYEDYRIYCRHDGLSDKYILASNSFSRNLRERFPTIKGNPRHGSNRSVLNVKLLLKPKNWGGVF